MNPTPSPQERPEPPEGYRLIPREYLEAGNALPEDALFTGPGFGGWLKSGWRGSHIGEREDIAYLAYATRTPIPPVGREEKLPHVEYVTRGGAHEQRYKNGGLIRWRPASDCTLEEFKQQCEVGISTSPTATVAPSPLDKDAEIARLKRELQILQGEWDETRRILHEQDADVTTLRSTNQSLLALVDTLAGALKDLHHLPNCVVNDIWPHNDRCTCGKTAALAAVTEFKAKGETK